MQLTRDRIGKWVMVGCLCVSAACTSEFAAPVVPDPGTTSSPPAVWLLRAVDSTAQPGSARDVWMGTATGTTTGTTTHVRVVDANGHPVAGAPVHFVVRRDNPGAADAAPLMEATVVSARDGLASLHDVAFPERDTVADMYVVSASLANDPSQMMHSRVRAWRDVSRFGGNAALVLSVMPIAMSHVGAILPLGTFNVNNALPSADAIVVPVHGPMPTVRAMADGMVTELNAGRGEITVRVRDDIRIRYSGVDLRTALWVGAVVREGATLGTVRTPTPESPGLGVRVLDASVQRSNWIRPERYGARRNTAFFVRYLADTFRSDAYALVRRAAPDLAGTIDYDRAGKLVGTWFDPFASLVSNGAALTGMPMNLWQSSVQHQSEIDPTAALDGLALTFAYDAQAPGEIRLAVGSRLGNTLGFSGVYAVAWEDPDPARVSEASGVVRYRLFARGDVSRIGPPAQTLLVQLLEGEQVRVELVPGDSAGAGFSPRAVILTR